MSIRFNCIACRTVLKLESMIDDEKKVRCTSCGIVLLVAPDPANPKVLKSSIPDLTAKRDLQIKAERKREKILTYSLAAATGALALGLIIWNLLPASDRGAIEGTVTLDDKKVEAGQITFIGIDNPAITVTTDIVDGQYHLDRKHGPALGKNKIQISVMRPTGKQIEKIGGRPGEMTDELIDVVAKEFGAESKLEFDVKSGANRRDLYPLSADALAANPATAGR